MPYRYRLLQSPRGISLPGFRALAALVGLILMWAWLWFCTAGGTL